MGRVTRPRTRRRPGNAARASTQARGTPRTRHSAVLTSEVTSESRRASRTSAEPRIDAHVRPRRPLEQAHQGQHQEADGHDGEGDEAAGTRPAETPSSASRVTAARSRRRPGPACPSSERTKSTKARAVATSLGLLGDGDGVGGHHVLVLGDLDALDRVAGGHHVGRGTRRRRRPRRPRPWSAGRARPARRCRPTARPRCRRGPRGRTSRTAPPRRTGPRRGPRRPGRPGPRPRPGCPGGTAISSSLVAKSVGSPSSAPAATRSSMVEVDAVATTSAGAPSVTWVTRPDDGPKLNSTEAPGLAASKSSPISGVHVGQRRGGEHGDRTRWPRRRPCRPLRWSSPEVGRRRSRRPRPAGPGRRPARRQGAAGACRGRRAVGVTGGPGRPGRRWT